MPLRNFMKTIFQSPQSTQQPPPLDGEIVYSKNNVCVHPPGPLANDIEHYPGYLTVFAKITGDSTSLILNWIPNKRLKHGRNPVGEKDVVPIHNKSLSCTEDISPSLLRVPPISKKSASTSNSPTRDDDYIGNFKDLCKKEISSAEELLLTPSNLLSEYEVVSNTTDNQELSDASINSSSTEGPDSDTETDYSLEELPENPSDQEKPSSDDKTLTLLKLSLSSISLKKDQNENKEQNTDMKNEKETQEKSESDIIMKRGLNTEQESQKSEHLNSVNESGEAENIDDEHNHERLNGGQHLDLPLEPNECPISPPAVYNMQFPENSISFVSTPSSNNSSNATTPLPYKGHVKRPAKDQACGVFTVDLALMRSLRLFFSNDVCNSGQLVIASQESQYKILHFHHGGLDALANVLEEWKFAVKQNEKDSEQIAVRQFSICGPQLSVGQCHPEEGLYRRLSRDAWLLHVNEFGQIEDEYNIRKAVFFGGMDPSLRCEVWLFLLKCYPFSSTDDERQYIRTAKEREYEVINSMRVNMSEEENENFSRTIACIVEKDVLRTDRANPYYRGDNNPNLQIMRHILLNYSVYTKTGYTQGMSDLLSPLLIELKDEAETFWCFIGLMQRTIFISSPKDDDMEKQLLYLRELLRLMQPQFYQHLVLCGPDAMELLFVHRWILLCFKREFSEHEALMMWESCWAHYQTDYFHLFICVAIIALYGLDVVENKLASDEMLLHFSNLSMQMNGHIVLRKARGQLHTFRVRPRVPCTLHDICMRSPPGVWDSGYTPTVECTGDHENGDCTYGGTVSANEAPQVAKKTKESKFRNFFR